MIKLFLYTIIVVLILTACGKSLPALENVDLKQWAQDRNACLGLRSTMLEAMRNQKNELLGLSEIQIVSLLNRPDQNELYKRNQKFYYYSLLPSKRCAENLPHESLQLVIRFNAMGIAKEVSIE